MIIQFVVYILLPLVLALYIYGKKKYGYLKKLDIPCLEPTFPLGNMDGVGSKVHITERLREVYEAFKNKDKIAGIYTMFNPALVLINLDLIKNVMIKDFHKFTDRGVYYNAKGDPISANMFALEGAEWKFIRTKLSPTFTTGKIKNMFNTVLDMSEELVKVIDAGKLFETKDLCNRYICDVIGIVAFGLDCEALKNRDSKLLQAGQSFVRMTALETMKFFFISAFKNISKFLNLRQFRSDSAQYFVDTVRSAIEYRESNNIERKDFLNSLMQLKNTGTIDGEKFDNDKKLTFNQIAAEAFLFFFAGFETSSTTMSFALFELADNPEIQVKARQEVKDVLSKYGGKFTYESIAEMTYLNQVFNETLRKYPVVGVLLRYCTEDCEIPDSKHVIKKGTQVFVPVYGIHTDENIYPNPTQFDPSRFTPEEVAKRHNCAFIPFGDGPRVCIGQRFALLQVKYGLAKVLLEYDLTVDAKTISPLELTKGSITVEAKGGIWLNYKKLHIDM